MTLSTNTGTVDSNTERTLERSLLLTSLKSTPARPSTGRKLSGSCALLTPSLSSFAYTGNPILTQATPYAILNNISVPTVPLAKYVPIWGPTFASMQRLKNSAATMAPSACLVYPTIARGVAKSNGPTKQHEVLSLPSRIHCINLRLML